MLAQAPGKNGNGYGYDFVQQVDDPCEIRIWRNKSTSRTEKIIVPECSVVL